MLYFLGNCQADFLSRAMAGRGHPCTYRVLASPMTLPSHKGIPGSLAAIHRDMALGDYLHGRELAHQFEPIGPHDPPPSLIVLSLFHENTPLFVHNTEKYVFFMDPRALTDKPELMDWAKRECRMFEPNPATYLRRYGEMLSRLRADFPAVPMVILSRLTPHPAFGPEPFSYLKGWTDLSRGAMDTLRTLADSLEHVHIIDMDRVFGGIWSESDKRIEGQCPFLKITLEEKDGRVTGLHARRDIEHIGTMPDRLADTLTRFLESGKLSYLAQETIRPEWRAHWRISRLDDDRMLELLTSGANYHCAEAVGAFFTDLGRDRTELLVQARRHMPVCHMTLHMIKAYGRIQRNPALALWCNAHLEAASAFAANGPLYRQAYMERVTAMRAHALG
ncbi:MAG: SGNH/GDSL hydrolase family protein [Pseudomonadota bacterium]